MPRRKEFIRPIRLRNSVRRQGTREEEIRLISLLKLGSISESV